MFPSSIYYSFNSLDVTSRHFPAPHFTSFIAHFLFILLCLFHPLSPISFFLPNPTAHIWVHAFAHILKSSHHNLAYTTFLYFSVAFCYFEMKWQTNTHIHSSPHIIIMSNWLPSDGILSLWKNVADSGLMGEVLSSLQTELLGTLKGVEVRSKKAKLQETGEFSLWDLAYDQNALNLVQC